MKLIIIVILLLLSGCGGTIGFHDPLITKQGIHKNGTQCFFDPYGPVESTPIIWKDKVLLVTGNSDEAPESRTVKVSTFDCQTISVSSLPGFNYMNAFVNAGDLYVFGAKDGNIWSTKTQDLKTWSSPIRVLLMPAGMEAFNTSITINPQGFLMAIETKDKVFTQEFVGHFAQSNDLQTWAMLPNVMTEPKGVINCPWVWFDGNKYYVMYLNNFDTHIARSSDLTIWETSPTPVFTASPGEGNNNSDVAAVEYQGKTYFAYAIGDQTKWLTVATANYDGSLQEFARSFFND